MRLISFPPGSALRALPSIFAVGWVIGFASVEVGAQQLPETACPSPDSLLARIAARVVSSPSFGFNAARQPIARTPVRDLRALRNPRDRKICSALWQTPQVAQLARVYDRVAFFEGRDGFVVAFAQSTSAARRRLSRALVFGRDLRLVALHPRIQ